MNEVSDSKSWVMSKYKEEWIWWRNGTQGIFFFLSNRTMNLIARTQNLLSMRFCVWKYIIS